MGNVSMLSIIKESVIDRKARVLAFTKVYNSKVDKYTYIGRRASVINADIGKFCSIASDVQIGVASHPSHWVSSSPVFCKGKNVLKKNFVELDFEPYEKTVIGNDVWIGINVVIKGGIKIGDGSIIGAGSVVTKDVPPYTVVGGVPAKEIKKRFKDSEIESLLKIKWWDLNDDKLNDMAVNFNDVTKFIENYKGVIER